MKPLFILLGVFLISITIMKLAKGESNYLLAGKIALAGMLLFTALGHFLYTKGMILMIPDFCSFRQEIVYLTGFLEIAAAIGIFIPDIRILTAILLITFFIMILPANIYASLKHLNYQTGAFDGNGISYLWFRIPFQLLLICWTYYFVFRQ